MAKKFYVWADANCNGENIEWVELTAAEFIKFIRNPENRGRRIIKLSDPYLYEDDDIYIEATEEQYVEWNKEYKHSLYVNRVNRNQSVVSIDMLQEISDTFDIPSEDCFIDEIFGDEISDMFNAIDQLPERMKQIVHIKYESIQTKTTISNLCKKYGIPRRTYYRELEEAFLMIRTSISPL